MYSAWLTGLLYQFFDVDIYFLLFTCESKSCKTNFFEDCKSENQR